MIKEFVLSHVYGTIKLVVNEFHWKTTHQNSQFWRGVVHSQIECTDFKSSKKSLDFSDFFSDFLDFWLIFWIFW